MTNAPEHAALTEQTPPSWREALRTRTHVNAEPQAIAVASRRTETITRRRLVASSFWGGLGLSLLAAAGGLVDFLVPRGVTGFGGPVPAGNVTDYPPGAPPVHHIAGQFWLVNLDLADAAPNGSGGGEGLLALWRKCPHLGCSVPWRDAFVLRGTDTPGWFRCGCHGSTYTKAGVRIEGPATRSMDTMRIDIGEDGAITVQTGDITPGGDDNPSRALQI